MVLKQQVSPAGLKDADLRKDGPPGHFTKGQTTYCSFKAFGRLWITKNRLTDILLRKKLPFIKLSSNVKKMWNKMLPWQNNTHTKRDKWEAINEAVWIIFGCEASGGPWCPLAQQRVERQTAGENSHLSCLSDMVILAWHRLLYIFLCLHCLLANSLSAPILRILPPPPPRTLARPCTSGMENDCHLSPSFHL